MTYKMNNKQDSMKLQTCVLKVNIPCPCDGCKQKIKTVLKKIGGVEKTNIDLEQEKVTVYGNADPLTLIKKLSKSGKHAELWGPQKGSGGGKGNQQMQATNNKGFKDLNPSNKNQKFDIPIGGGGGGGRFNECDEDDDSCDGHDFKKPNKILTGPGVGGYGPVGMMNEKNGPSGGFDLHVQLKGKGGNNDAKKGNGGTKGGGGGDGGGKDGKKSKGGGSSGGFFGGMICKALFGGGKKKHGGSNSKGGKNGSGGKMKDGGLDKKGGGKPEGKFSSDKQNEFLESCKPGNGGGGGGPRMEHNCGNGGWNNNQMGGNPMMPQMGNYPMGPMGGHPVGQMQPMAYRGQGMVDGSHYNQQQYQQQYHQQQYMQPMMMMNQPKVNIYPQMMYGQPPPSAYGPPMGAPMNDGMTHMFSDENTDGCSIM
ncbi:uncharacterized protein LOC143580200 [Bidens hawaiensis]|uniref:uncharacterized protein LOC143580200 n=1 Tax=Bidens hawaiensis TaxID=980011 RepID=UPI004049C8C6